MVSNATACSWSSAFANSFVEVRFDPRSGGPLDLRIRYVKKLPDLQETQLIIGTIKSNRLKVQI
jgi:hypothetical protein